MKNFWSFRKSILVGICGICLVAYGATQWGNLLIKGNLTVDGTGTLGGVSILSQTNTVSGITNKTFTSPAINGSNLNFGTASNTNRLLLPNDTTTNLDALTDTAALLAYDTTLGKVVYNNGSSWTSVGSGAGGGNNQSEYITNGTFEDNSTGWSTYADAAATSPVDCTGGSPNVTVARTTTAGEFLKGTASLEMVKGAANRQGEGFSYDFSIDYQDYNNLRPVYLSFDYKATANYASSDVKVFVYDKDAATLLGVQDIANLSGALVASTGGNKWTGVFYPTTATSNDYRLCVHVSSTNANAYDFHLDSVHAGPSPEVPGALITEWQSYTPTTNGLGTIASVETKWRRVGDSIEIAGNFTTGTTTASEARLGLPSGLTSAAISNIRVAGVVFPDNVDGGSNISIFSALIEPSVTYLTFGFRNSSAAPLTKQNGNGIFASSTRISIHATVPIANWAASASLSSNELFYTTVKAKANGDAASASAGNPIIAPTEVYDRHNAYNNSTGLFTAPKNGCYRIHGFIISGNAAIALSSEVDGTGVSNIGITDASGEGIFDGIECINKDQTLSVSPGGTLDATSITLYFDEVPDFTTFTQIDATYWPWTSFTPTGSWSTNTTYTGFWRRVGEDMEVKTLVSISGTPTSASLTVNLPTGYTIDTAKLVSTNSNAVHDGSSCSILDNGSASYSCHVFYSSTSAVAIVINNVSSTYPSIADVTQAVPMTFASGDFVRLSYRVPITGWSR